MGAPTSPGAITSLCDGVATGSATNHGAGHGIGHENVGAGHEIRMRRVHYAIPIPSLQPPGIAWFHPHAHTLSAMQVGAGLSGLISIGDLCAFPNMAPASRAGWCVTNGPTSRLKQSIVSRTLTLKDVQVARTPNVLSSMTPPASGPTSAGGIIAVSCLGAPDSFGDGWCRYTRSDPTKRDQSPVEAGDWLFTVNGQVAPRIDMVPGRQEVWRIANVAANTVYRLALCSTAALARDDAGLAYWANAAKTGGPEGDGYHELRRCDGDRRLKFQIVSLDGAATFGLADGSASPRQRIDDELTLLPGTRAEIIVTLPPGSGDVALAQLGFNYPDMWPATVLAHLKASPGPGAPSLPPLEFLPASAVAASADPAFPPRAQKARPAPTPETVIVEGDATVAIVFGRFVDATRPKTADTEILVLKAIVVDGARPADDQLAGFEACLALMRPNPNDDPRALPACAPFIGRVFDPNRLDLKVKFGSKLTFSFFNLTTELHNFHIHQQKFSILRTGAEDLPADAAPPVAVTSPVVTPTTPPSVALARAKVARLPSAGPAAAAFRAVGLRATTADRADGTVDSVPAIPLFFKNGKVGGVAQAVVAFDKPQQIGTFVFHCHILEHEDKGMMSTITVERR